MRRRRNRLAALIMVLVIVMDVIILSIRVTAAEAAEKAILVYAAYLDVEDEEKLLNGNKKENVGYYITLEDGETMESISQKLGITTESLMLENPGCKDPKQPLQKEAYVQIPENGVNWAYLNINVYCKIAPGNCLGNIAKYFDATVSYIQAINDIKNPDIIYANSIICVRKNIGY